MARQVHGDCSDAEEDRLNSGLSGAARVHRASMARLQSQRDAVDATIRALKEEEAHLQDNIASVVAEDKQVAFTAARLEDARNADIPRVKYVQL